MALDTHAKNEPTFDHSGGGGCTVRPAGFYRYDHNLLNYKHEEFHDIIYV